MMLTRQVIIKHSGRVVLRWEETEDTPPQAAYFLPETGYNLSTLANWLVSVPFLNPFEILPLSLNMAEWDMLKIDKSPYRLVATRVGDGTYRLTYYDRLGNGENVDFVFAVELHARLNARLRQIEIEHAALPIN